MQLPTEIPWLSHSFPFYAAVSETAAGMRAAILAGLPDPARARELVELYYRHAAWMFVTPPPIEASPLFRPPRDCLR